MLCADPIDHGLCAGTLKDKIDARCHGGRHRRAEDAAFHQPLPFPGFIDWMHQRQFVLAIQGLSHLRRQRSQGAAAIGREIRAVSGVDTDDRRSPPFREHKKNAVRKRRWNGNLFHFAQYILIASRTKTPVPSPPYLSMFWFISPPHAYA